jgi:hypothetical protein
MSTGAVGPSINSGVLLELLICANDWLQLRRSVTYDHL